MSPDTHNQRQAAHDATSVECDEIRAVLYDYMARELGEMRSRLVREHLRHCPTCSGEAAAIEAALQALRETAPPSTDTATPALSAGRRRRLRLLVRHPWLDWIDRHARLFALLVTCLILAVVLLTLRSCTFLPPPLDTDGNIPIWRYMRNGPLPAQVDRHFREKAAQEEEIPTAETPARP